MKTYGIKNNNIVYSDFDYHLENLRLKGFSVQEKVLSENECNILIDKLELIYQKQEQEFGRKNLELIKELDTCRMPFLYEKDFLNLFMKDLIIQIAEKVLGQSNILHLQNGVINRPNQEHHQSSWHRDLPYQDWTISKPIGFNAFYCLTDFTETNGATWLLPYSHRSALFPSESFVSENAVQIKAKRGSVMFFDSMVFHKSGYNSSTANRIGINNMFVAPILKQQINIPEQIKNLNLSEREQAILGVGFNVPMSVADYRLKRLEKLKNRNGQ
jgi:ectoine hydroxylase-related dioxygenase (phytanoyl-CoA dioxygenase family)